MSLNATYSTTTPAFKLTTTPTTGVALPATDPSQYGNRPLAAFLQAVTHDMRFTTDGSTPTSSHGMVLTAGAAPFLYAGNLVDIQFIQAASGSVLNVVYAPISATVGPQGPPGPNGVSNIPGPAGPPGPAGGLLSGGARVVGPFRCLYTTPELDVSAGGDGLDLMTLTPGDVLLNVFIRRNISWVDTNGNANTFELGVRFGDTVIFGDSTIYWDVADDITLDDSTGDMTLPADPTSASHDIFSQFAITAAALPYVVNNAGTLQATIEYDTGSGAVVLESGDTDMWVVVATPASS